MTSFTATAAYNLGYLVEVVRSEVQKRDSGLQTAREALDAVALAANRAENRFRNVPRYGPDPDDPRRHP